jgi:SnoaL-like domain
MTRKYLTAIAAIAVLIGGVAISYAETRKSSLTADDYIEIQQLYARYNMSIDAGDAEAYAATFTPDGVFNTFNGHDALVGFIHRWHDAMKGGNMRHWNTNLAIMGTPEGASGAVYLLLVDVSVRPPAISSAAKYEDQLVKTPDGWRFKKRVTKGEGPPPAAPAAKQ